MPTNLSLSIDERTPSPKGYMLFGAAGTSNAPQATPTGFENGPRGSRAINRPPLRGFKSVQSLARAKSGRQSEPRRRQSEPRRGDLFIAREPRGPFSNPVGVAFRWGECRREGPHGRSVN